MVTATTTLRELYLYRSHVDAQNTYYPESVLLIGRVLQFSRKSRCKDGEVETGGKQTCTFFYVTKEFSWMLFWVTGRQLKIL